MQPLTKELTDAMLMMFWRGTRDKVKYVTLEYLLWALIQTESVSKALSMFDLKPEDLLKVLDKSIRKEASEMPCKMEKAEPVMTQSMRRVIVNAEAISRKERKDQIDSLTVLEALMAEKDSEATYILNTFDFNRDDLSEYRENLSHEEKESRNSTSNSSFARPPEDTYINPYYTPRHNQPDDDEAETMQPNGPRKPKEKSMLALFALNLNEEAKAGRIDPIIGRQDEVERVMQVICRRRKNNPLLVGEAGVGKTAVAEGLAYRIVNGDVPDALKGFEVYALDLGALVAGTKFRGDFEERMKNLIKEVESKPKVILFLDEIHQVLGTGAQEGAGDAATLLKPSLARGTVRVIGATTYDELRKFLNKDSALLRRFQKIDIEEPSQEDTIEILKGLKSRFEEHHGVKYQESAIKAAVELTDRYITDRKLPDKAIDVIDEAGARKRLKTNVKEAVITRAEIEEVISKLARIPPQAVNTDDKKRLKGLDEALKKVIYGQDEAINTVSDAIKLSRSGLGKIDRPIGSFLFAGPTGVGKTELARQLASQLGIELIRFDMSEYVERFNVSRLIGAPPGYVGYDQGGQLTEAVTKHPHAVLLMDEIEKAHPDIYNILLQVMDHGALTDNNGKTADFRNVILIMTTNAGSKDLSRRSIGFVKESHYGDESAELAKTFTPEFRNRLDAIISFKPLGEEQIKKVAEKMLGEIKVQLKRRRVEAVFGENLIAWLAQKGFDPTMGARPMQRIIQSTVRKALADELLFGKLSRGGLVYVDRDENGKITLDVRKKGDVKKDEDKVPATADA
ncbi:MAG: AAA family ATPase [Burkholderiales bacterium]|nr:AAA family ATPase [Burkholderiales bacterium]